jgi:hypothetical protein
VIKADDDICLGCLFINDPTPAWPRHPHVIVSDPAQDPDRVVVVNLSTEPSLGDVGYVLEAGVHRSITQPSYIRCDLVIISTFENIKALQQRNAITVHKKVSPEVLTRIHHALAESRRPSQDVKAILRAQRLIPNIKEK